MWFAKAWNKSVLLEQLKEYICENELQNCVDKPESQKKSPPLKVASPENPLIAAYIVRQAEALERQRKDAGQTSEHIILTLKDPLFLHQRKNVSSSKTLKAGVPVPLRKTECVEDKVEDIEEA